MSIVTMNGVAVCNKISCSVTLTIVYSTELLKDEFPSVPVKYITSIVQQQKTIYKAYGVLEKQVRDYGLIAPSFHKIVKSRSKRGIELQLIAKGSQLPKELHAAKKKVEIEAGEYSCTICTKQIRSRSTKNTCLVFRIQFSVNPLG